MSTIIPAFDRVGPRGAAVVVALALCTLPPALAQDQPLRPRDEQIDVWDWLRRLRNKEQPAGPGQSSEEAGGTDVLLIPIIASKPSTGLTFGAGASFEFPLGPLQDTYVSSLLTGASYSTKKQYSVVARLALFGTGNRWTLSGDHHYQLKGQEAYGFGTDAPASDRVDIQYNSIKVMDTYYREVANDLFAGAGFQFLRQTNVGPVDEAETGWTESPYLRYSEHYGFDLSGQSSVGVNVSLRRDSRDNVSDPNRGWLTEATYLTHFAGFLGGDSTWQRLYLDLRVYRSLTKDTRHKLALWSYGDFVTGGTAPYLALPATGTDTQGRSGRGYAEGRFRGDRLVYGEVEYRVSLRRDGLAGLVGFLNATSVGSAFDDDQLFDTVAIGGGFGFRLRVAKRSRTNVCLDFGWGRDGSYGVYLALAEAF